MFQMCQMWGDELIGWTKTAEHILAVTFLGAAHHRLPAMPYLTNTTDADVGNLRTVTSFSIVPWATKG